MTIMSIGEEQVECPLCMEPLEMDDLNFFPCTCGYQICRFCWHRIRTDENGLCPACRKAYPEDPAEFKPLTDDELHRIKKERKLKDLQRKQKAAESRKHLANVRVVQKNLVFVVGLSQRLGDVETLKKHDYFGKFGKMVKVVINQSTTYAGSQVGGPSASAYITYQKPEDALRAIQAVNNIHVDGRTLKASLGTTKYCSHFLKGTQCPKPDCMYLHDLGDEAASFTKEEMQQGKHQEYEQKLIETYMNHLNTVNLSTATTTSTTTTQTQPSTSKSRKKKGHSSSTSNTSSTAATTDTISPPLPAQQGNKEAWPSLSSSGSSSKNSEHRRTNSSGGGGGGGKGSQSSSKSPSPVTSTPSTTTTPTSHTQPPSKPPCLLDVAVTRPPGLHTTLHRQSPDNTKHCRHTLNTDTGSTLTTLPTATTTTEANQIPPLLPAEPNRQPNTQSFPSHSQHSQLLGSQRSTSLFGDTTDNMSLFGLSGFMRKPPSTTSSMLPLETNLTTAEESIPDTITVNTATDWSAAFGFKSEASIVSSAAAAPVSSVIPGALSGASAAQTAGTSSEQTSALGLDSGTSAASFTSSTHDDGTDDDLGFDPWNESTKALQDLMEKESSLPASGHSAFQSESSQHQRSKLPPGFTHNHVQQHNSAFPHNPLLTGSRMMSLMKLNPQPSGTTPPPPPGVLPTNPAPGLHSSAGLNPLDAAAPMFMPQNTAHFGGSGAHFGNGLPEADSGAGEAYNMKDWQEGLRALLPNINISFGSAQLAQQQQQQQQLQKQQAASAASRNYDMMWDPAVVSASYASADQNGDEPHWMASLQSLTDDPICHAAPVNHSLNQALNQSTSLNGPASMAPQLNHFPYASKLLPLGLRSGSAAPGLVNTAAASAVTTPPPGFQHPIRAQPLLTDTPTHPRADAFQ